MNSQTHEGLRRDVGVWGLGSNLINTVVGAGIFILPAVMGPFGVTLMIVGAAISMFGYLSGDILNMPRVIFGAARDRVIPIPALARIHPRFATPYMSIILFAALGCVYAISGGFTQLAILSSASSLMIYLGVALAVIKLRLTKAHDPETFRIPGGYTVPILAVIAIGWFLSNLSMKGKIGMAIFIGILSVLFFVMTWLRKRHRDMQKLPTG